MKQYISPQRPISRSFVAVHNQDIYIGLTERLINVDLSSLPRQIHHRLRHLSCQVYDRLYFDIEPELGLAAVSFLAHHNGTKSFWFYIHQQTMRPDTNILVEHCSGKDIQANNMF